MKLKRLVELKGELKQLFADKHGPDAYKKFYIESFNEKPEMQNGNFNRDAQIHLSLYFMAYALEHESKSELARAFKQIAVKPWGDGKKPTEADVEAMLQYAREYVDTYIKNDDQDTKPRSPSVAA